MRAHHHDAYGYIPPKQIFIMGLFAHAMTDSSHFAPLFAVGVLHVRTFQVTEVSIVDGQLFGNVHDGHRKVVETVPTRIVHFFDNM